MSVPTQISDGDWRRLIPMEGGKIEFPFSDKGDNESFVETLKYRMDRGAFRPRTSMTQTRCTLGTGYLVRQGDPHDVGCNLLEWEDRFAMVPNKRTEYGSFNYTAQWFATVIEANVDPSKYFYNVNYDIEEQTFTVSAEFEYEYFATTPPSALIKPRVFLLFGRMYNIGGTPVIGNRLVAEDSTVTIWEGKIYERRTPYVKLTSTGALVP